MKERIADRLKAYADKIPRKPGPQEPRVKETPKPVPKLPEEPRTTSSGPGFPPLPQPKPVQEEGVYEFVDDTVDAAVHGSAAGIHEYAVYQQANPEAIVVYCSDPRFQAAFDEFIAEELKLEKGSFIPIVVSGSASILSQPLKLPKEFKFLRERFESFKQRFPGIKRIILINHEDCKYHHAIKSRFAGLSGRLPGKIVNAVEQHKAELASVIKLAKSFIPVLSQVSTELYYAKFTNAAHDKVVFEKVLTV